MPLPTSNLTFHADASVDTDLWQATGPFSDHPVDGEEVFYWDDVEHGAGSAEYLNTNGPAWRSGTPLMALPCLDFNGSTDSMRVLPGTAGTYLSVSAFTVLVAVYVEGIALNAANSYQNDAIVADGSGYFGIHLKNAADPHVLFYNYSGADTKVSLPITLNVSHVLMFRHESGNLYASVDGGAETSVASGNTDTLGAELQIGNGSGSIFYNGRIGEFAVYNAALTGTDLTDAVSYFTAKWLGVAPSGGGPLIAGGLTKGALIRGGRLRAA